MSAKKILLDWHTSGLTAYAIIRREADGYLLNAADGAFAESPGEPYLVLAENSVLKGRYELSESRAAWADGLYTGVIYQQIGESPSPADDMIIGSWQTYVVSDSEIFLDAPVSSRLSLADYRATAGIGMIAVNHNTGGSDALAFITSFGQGIDNGTILAYLKTDYDAGRRGADCLKARSSTDVNGRWVTEMYLDPAIYTLVYFKQGEYGPSTKEVTVE